ncbi:glycosyltransferase [Microbacterium sp. RURRCA19A]|uniref:glycosyltransferase n=1 Tax=Microbacterium sp. RURRCA19A TaxID=1907391 RepID=UPI0009574ECF|nr:glycosyltransferase [Microbacterium sp. RURRCA19A]SIR99038.1 Glycosyltransferase involved in cell wall bisynthesis [Microbacterium sp. RURRCA19A]
MHVVMFADQHVESLGGAQVSMRLQRRFLERAGHTVTVVAPRMHRPAPTDPAYVDLPSIPVTPDREYALSWPGIRIDRFVDAAMARRAPVDVVHVQADFWGAFIGHRYAARHGLPVVHTMHNRVDVGIEATAPFPALVLRVLNVWARRALRPALRVREARRVPDGWAYLRRLAGLSAAVTAPSAHFARRLEAHGAMPGASGAAETAGVDVVWNGIDDDILDAALAAGPVERRPGRPRFVWIGRMSPEKRLLPFLEAVAESGIDAEVEVIGGGAQLRAARRLVERTRPVASIRFAGRMPYARTLARLAEADAVVQTSIGFETQGMTVFEAASLGTPAVVSDPDIAAELGGGVWSVADATVPALAETLRRAAADIAEGSPVAVDPSIEGRFRQSSRTAAMVEVYARAVAPR